MRMKIYFVLSWKYCLGNLAICIKFLPEIRVEINNTESCVLYLAITFLKMIFHTISKNDFSYKVYIILNKGGELKYKN